VVAAAAVVAVATASTVNSRATLPRAVPTTTKCAIFKIPSRDQIGCTILPSNSKSIKESSSNPNLFFNLSTIISNFASNFYQFFASFLPIPRCRESSS